MNKNDTIKIGKQLQSMRKRRYQEDSDRYAYCKNQQTFADKIDRTRETIAKWETNNGTPALNEFMKVCKLLNCEPNYLLGVNDVISEKVNSISSATGLTNMAVERILYNDFLRELLNYLLEQDNYTNVIRNLYQIVKANVESEKILKENYCGMFITRIENIYFKATLDKPFHNNNKREYAKLLHQELDIDYCEFLSAMEKHNDIPADYEALVNYMMDCMTEKGVEEFCKRTYQNDYETVDKYFECFINDIVEQTYDVFFHCQTKNIWMGQIMQEISKNIFDFKYEV